MCQERICKVTKFLRDFGCQSEESWSFPAALSEIFTNFAH